MHRLICSFAPLFLISALSAKGDAAIGPGGGEAQTTAGPASTRSPHSRPEERAFAAARVATGFVFCDGRYVPAPYRIRATARGLFVNDRLVRARRPRQRGRGRFGRRDWDGDRGDGPPGFGTGRMDREFGFGRRSFERVQDHLELDGVLVVFADRPMVLVEPGTQSYAFLKIATDPASRSEFFPELFQGQIPEADRERWTEWLEGYTAPDELLTRGSAAIAHIDREAEKLQNSVAAQKRLSALGYPLTLAGMVLGVLALGHLLTARPGGEGDSADEGVRSKLVRTTLISVALIAILSAFDLTWTVLAYKAGGMAELNPLGSRLIDDPAALIAFKTGATTVGCGILVLLRRHPTARLASWWMCLVLTVLTFRWIVFNSMFVA